MQILIVLAMLVCAPADHFEVESARDYRVGALPVSLSVRAMDASGKVVSNFCGPVAVEGVLRDTPDGPQAVLVSEKFVRGETILEKVRIPDGSMHVTSELAHGQWKTDSIRTLPGVLSILPPVAAIVLALLTGQALIALFSGVFLGAIFVYGYNPLTALLRVFDTHLVSAAANPDHAAILLFTMALGGMVGILAQSGGTQALVGVISKRATSRRPGMVMSWFTGLVIFFDDYANCLLVGNTLRPFTDKLNISREKLAYIVDSTAAPVTSIALISTWVGFQLSRIEPLAKASGISDYELFLNMLPYSFYSFFTIFFVLMIAVTGRDFGPMLAAEKRAAGGKLLRDGAKPMMDEELTEMSPPKDANPHWSLAVVPILSIILIVAGGLYASGVQNAGAGSGLRKIISSADSYAVLLWASFGGSLIAAGYALARRSLKVGEAVDAWVSGCKAMVIAILILILAWAIGDICQEFLQTGPWVISQFSPSPQWIPAMTFVLCAIIALATGSSFSTMAIVIPIAGPMAWAATGDTNGLDPAVGESIRVATLSSVLGGAVFGDHCSPISDTTIMSSMSCASDHIDHVKTQAPYAAVCGGAAVFLGYLPAGFGIPPIVTLPIGMVALWALVRYYGKPSGADS